MPSIGRGGAGNILAASNATIPSDLESNRQAVEEDYTQDQLEQKEKQEWAHQGRGGAGNFFSPKELVQKGKFEGAQTSHVLGDGTPESVKTTAESGTGSVSVAPAFRGRGGAGNYSFGPSEIEEKRTAEDEEAKKDWLRGQIEKGVEEGLARPEKAKLPGGEPF